MYSFFILGQIPGTDVVLTFWMWMELAALLVTLLAWMAYRRHLAFASYRVPTISNESDNLVTVTAQ